MSETDACPTCALVDRALGLHIHAKALLQWQCQTCGCDDYGFNVPWCLDEHIPAAEHQRVRTYAFDCVRQQAEAAGLRLLACRLPSRASVSLDEWRAYFVCH